MQFQGSLAQWFVLLQQRNYTKLTKKQYLELNVRIQKSLILDFDLQSAQDSALEDWKIDIERETNERKAAAAATSDFQDERKNEPYLIEFERLSEFFFDLCLSWCQHLELELFLYFVNGVFLNITKGAHVNISEFKDLEDIEVLSIEFFNQLLQYRGKFEQHGDTTYQQWYNRNFMQQQAIVRNVQENLQTAFLGGKASENGGQKGESRILDLWIDMPQTNPVMQNGFLQQNFVRLDKDFQVMHKATRAQDLLIQSMTLMDQQVQQRVTDKMKTRSTGFGD